MRVSVANEGAAGGPVEPPPSVWDLAGRAPTPGEDLVAVGGDLRPGTLLEAYRHGLFPMGLGDGGSAPLGWWSPDPRGVLIPGEVHVSRSLRRTLPRFEIRVDTAFTQVVAGCADPSRDGAWITSDIAAAYTDLHHLGWAHSVECWLGQDLVGGLYGVLVGGLFAAESKFHRVPDASKAAVVALDALMRDGDPAGSAHVLIDVQWATPHLVSLGVRELPREEYRRRCALALREGTPRAFTRP